jgi:hypothetical protein
MSLFNWIKAWREFRLRLTLRFLVPPAQVFAFLGGLPTVGILASGR